MTLTGILPSTATETVPCCRGDGRAVILPPGKHGKHGKPGKAGKAQPSKAGWPLPRGPGRVLSVWTPPTLVRAGRSRLAAASRDLRVSQQPNPRN